MTKQEEIQDEEAREKHKSDWIKAEYETMGWNKEQEIVAVEPLVAPPDSFTIDTNKAISTMSKEEQDYIDRNVVNL